MNAMQNKLNKKIKASLEAEAESLIESGNQLFNQKNTYEAMKYYRQAQEVLDRIETEISSEKKKIPSKKYLLDSVLDFTNYETGKAPEINYNIPTSTSLPIRTYMEFAVDKDWFDPINAYHFMSVEQIKEHIEAVKPEYKITPNIFKDLKGRYSNDKLFQILQKIPWNHVFWKTFPEGHPLRDLTIDKVEAIYGAKLKENHNIIKENVYNTMEYLESIDKSINHNKIVGSIIQIANYLKKYQEFDPSNLYEREYLYLQDSMKQLILKIQGSIQIFYNYIDKNIDYTESIEEDIKIYQKEKDSINSTYNNEKQYLDNEYNSKISKIQKELDSFPDLQRQIEDEKKFLSNKKDDAKVALSTVNQLLPIINQLEIEEKKNEKIKKILENLEKEQINLSLEIEKKENKIKHYSTINSIKLKGYKPTEYDKYIKDYMQLITESKEKIENKKLELSDLLDKIHSDISSSSEFSKDEKNELIKKINKNSNDAQIRNLLSTIQSREVIRYQKSAHVRRKLEKLESGNIKTGNSMIFYVRTERTGKLKQITADSLLIDDLKGVLVKLQQELKLLKSELTAVERKKADNTRFFSETETVKDDVYSNKISLEIQSLVNSPNFSQEIAQRVSRLVKDAISSNKINFNGLSKILASQISKLEQITSEENNLFNKKEELYSVLINKLNNLNIRKVLCTTEEISGIKSLFESIISGSTKSLDIMNLMNKINGKFISAHEEYYRDLDLLKNSYNEKLRQNQREYITCKIEGTNIIKESLLEALQNVFQIEDLINSILQISEKSLEILNTIFQIQKEQGKLEETINEIENYRVKSGRGDSPNNEFKINMVSQPFWVDNSSEFSKKKGADSSNIFITTFFPDNSQEKRYPTENEIADLKKMGYVPRLLKNFAGEYEIRFIKSQEELDPRIFIVEEYTVSVFPGDFGTGKTIDTFSLLPLEKTQFRMKKWSTSKKTKNTSTSVLENLNTESSDSFQKELEGELNASSESQRTTEVYASASASASGGWGPVSASVGVEAGASAGFSENRKNSVKSISKSMGNHTSQKNQSRENSITQDVSEEREEGEEELSIREIQNPNENRVVNYVFREMYQQYISIIHLTDVKIAYGTGFSQDYKEVPIHEIDSLINSIFRDGYDLKLCSEIRKIIKDRIFENFSYVLDYRNRPFNVIEPIMMPGTDDVPTGKYRFNSQPFYKYVLDRIKENEKEKGNYDDILKARIDHGVNGIILDTFSTSMKTDQILVDSVLGKGNVLDEYSLAQRIETIRRLQVENALLESTVEIKKHLSESLSNVASPEKVFDLYYKGFGLENYEKIANKISLFMNPDKLDHVLESESKSAKKNKGFDVTLK
ncbi:hypothetical protein DSAG12_02796 [Promethearchaeum syntrophicum]|uniref:Uncharacterized protein n=1 Tax=Promethearchaeum syntrophicum TaxID=2594042 RepID=A0A5B9DD97_9ARCH|nr:hypothetical protein [Candidatus Prometheoarchaeum syntrophicum]QEE16965.1 hypothetical protein DSAG12_02796 [Candidatus Prometheoarchaeum syntrophicum]